jgi:hypothetical protein
MNSIRNPEEEFLVKGRDRERVSDNSGGCGHVSVKNNTIILILTRRQSNKSVDNQHGMAYLKALM